MNNKRKAALKALRTAQDCVKVKAGKPLTGPTRARQQAVACGSTTGYVGWINHAGPVVDGTFQVQFDVPGDGWSSRWPRWAYEAALQAVLHRKKVWVIATGAPFGGNLLQVLVTNQDA